MEYINSTPRLRGSEGEALYEPTNQRRPFRGKYPPPVQHVHNIPGMGMVPWMGPTVHTDQSETLGEIGQPIRDFREK
jgi:hypothetical protein